MTLEDVLEDLINRLEPSGDKTISWDQVQRWPEGALEMFQNEGWIKPALFAKSVVCPGCEENCYMPVQAQTKNGQPTRIYVACDYRDDMGRIPIPQEMLQQWQITEDQVARWITRSLGIKGKPKKDKKSGTTHIGNFQGKKKSGLLQLDCQAPVSLKTSNHSQPLIEVFDIKENQLLINFESVTKMMDRTPPKKSYTPQVHRREARKLETKQKHQRVKKTYLQLKREKPGRSDSWYALQMELKGVEGYDSETIRKLIRK